jgi:peptidoglycan/xylan/chitin deacetylase (PgdA/CDA1 family)
MKNILSIDFEDWHQLVHRRIAGELIPASDGVFRQLDLFLNILAETGARGTFFTVGMLAERYPEMLRRIAAAGHELACHGYLHLIVHRLTPEKFREDTARAKRVLEDIVGTEVVGYRSPEFSIRLSNL